MKNNILGVDIGHGSIKVALVSNQQVTKAAMSMLPEAGMYEGPQDKVARIATALRTLMKNERIHASEAALVIPSSDFLIQTLDLPPMNQEEVKQNLMYEFRDQIEDDPTAYVYDYMSINPPEDLPDNIAGRMYLVGVAVAESYLEMMRETLSRAGLHMYTAAPELAAYKSMIRKTGQSNGEYCFIDIGNSGTEICLFHGDSYVTSQKIGSGLSSIEHLISEEEQISLEVARSYVTANHNQCLTKDSVMHLYQDLAVNIKQALEYYRMSSLGSRLQDVWLLGGGTTIRPLIGTINKQLENFKLHPASSFLPELQQQNVNGGMFIKAAGVAMHQ